MDENYCTRVDSKVAKRHKAYNLWKSEVLGKSQIWAETQPSILSRGKIMVTAIQNYSKADQSFLVLSSPT